MFGCLYARGAPVRLDRGGATGEVVAALGGPFAAFVTVDFGSESGGGGIFWLIEDLRTGRLLPRVEVRGRYATDVVVAPRGGLAWIVCNQSQRRACTSEHATFSVRARDSGRRARTRLLASGDDIAARSLTLKGSVISWTERGRRHRARLR